MSLFVCMGCGCIENSNLMSNSINKDNSDYPNMCRMEMDGYKDSDIQGEIRYLCSECNTGKWHNEFEKSFADDDDIQVAHLSEYNMITPYDHPDGSIIDTPEGYRIDERYTKLVEVFGEDINREDNILYKIYLEDKMNFNVCCLDILLELKHTDMVILDLHLDNAIRSSQIYSNESKSNTYLDYIGVTSNTVSRPDLSRRDKLKLTSIMDVLASTGLLSSLNLGNETSTTKVIQTDHDKERALKKAELKRELKQLKKSLGVKNKLYLDKYEEFKNI